MPGCADAVLHAHAARAADPRRAFLPRPRVGVASRSRALRARAAEIDELPLGSGAIAGTSYAIDVPRLATTLGFARSSRNSIDATGERDFVSTFLHACALSMVHVSRLAEDLILFTSEEFGFLELADTAATGSSLMPQKKNPDPLELVRGKAGRVIGRQTGWLATMKGLPIGYSKDLQEDKEAVFDAEDTAARVARRDGGGAPRHRTQPRVTAPRASSGLLLATDVADYLVAKGVPFRDAHAIVGALVRSLVKTGASFDDLSGGRVAAHSPHFDADVVQAMTPAASVERKRTPQSTHPDAVSTALAEAKSGRRSTRTVRKCAGSASWLFWSTTPTPSTPRSIRSGRFRGGRAQAVVVANALLARAVKPACIWHSGKLRARQTAEAVRTRLQSAGGALRDPGTATR